MNADLKYDIPIRSTAAPPEFLSSTLISSNPGLRSVWRALQMVAPTNSAVLIQGETGTGKELVARAVHDESPRKHGRYVKVNCAAMPAGLLESELFGHERGAFTGAVSRTDGRFQQANGGTLFLDEIGELPLELQPKLLRILQEQEYERLGSGRTIRVDVRVIAATNADLQRMVLERHFRADLFYRLNVFPIPIPPLRDRRDDIPLLTKHQGVVVWRADWGARPHQLVTVGTGEQADRLKHSFLRRHHGTSVCLANQEALVQAQADGEIG
jgi:transcriptional regulator with GAF, ATPase, and Fis domain